MDVGNVAGDCNPVIASTPWLQAQQNINIQ